MAVAKKSSRRQDRVAELTAEVQALKARLEVLEGASHSSNNNGHSQPAQSRRDLLKVAGAAVAGAAGSILLGRVPAAAATTDNFMLGVATNNASSTTELFPTGALSSPPASAPSPLFQTTGQGVPITTTVPATQSATAPTLQSIPLIGAIGAGTPLLPLVGDPPIHDYPGFAPIQGVGGQTTIQTSKGSKTYSEGVNGWGTGPTGIGVTGESDKGYGVAGGSGGIDVAALGNGRVLQLPLPDSMLTSPPAGPPKYPGGGLPNDFEQVRDANGVLWVSTPGSEWHRINSVIPITPFRLYDSRPFARPAGSTTDIPVAGAQQNGQTMIPANAVGVVGNLTALGPAADGFLTMYPTGSGLGQVNSLNYFRGVTALSNHVMVGLGSGGSVSVFVSQNGSTNFLFDVAGYLI